MHGDRTDEHAPEPAVRHARGSDAPAIAEVARRGATEVYEGTVDDRAIVENVRSAGYVDGLREHLRTVPDRDGYCYLVGGTPAGAATAVDGRAGASERAASGDGERPVPVPVHGFAQFVWAPMETDPFVDASECLLHSLYVDPDHWGEGLGTALVDAGITELPDDLTTLRLAVLRGNEVGVSFYESYGFERTGAAAIDVAGGTYDCYVYSLGL